ncbi:MAG: porin [Oscillatoriales cyanobacterium]|nr:MAG: porin [Oscillatoriales cyanobacterium]TAH17775.1 MAG: porin [Oscillatoriales cyanobacterium]
MNKSFWNLLLVSPAILGLSTVTCGGAIAVEATATAVVNQLATAQPSESIAAALITEPVAETVAAAPVASETLAINSSPATVELDTNSAAVALPQASDLAVQSSLNGAIGNTQLPTAAKVEIAQTAPAELSNPIVPAAPQALPTEQSGAMSQVTSVSQLSDVRPTDWAFQALQSLVERYGCIAGYPDGTYRGNRALTRYEFAAGLNACLDQVTKLISSSTGTFVTKNDLAVLQKLQESFAVELATLRGKVDALEARTAELEANQFSTTTKLVGEVIFLGSDTFGNGVKLHDDKTATNLGYRVRLNFNTSFTGKDLLRTRLQARNVANYGTATTTGTNMARLALTGEDGSQFSLDQAWYRFPLGNATAWFGPKGLRLDDIAELTAPFEAPGSGAVSAFGRYNPAVFRGPEGAGAALKYNFGAVRATVGYLASDGDAPNPVSGRGIFDGSFSAIGQLNLSLGKMLDVGATYTRKYNRSGDVAIMGNTGSSLANRPFGQAGTGSDNFGVQVNFKPSSRFQLGGWYGYTKAEQLRNSNRDATIQNAAITLGLSDFGRKGNLLGFIFGVPPKVTSSDAAKDRNTSYHLEGFYRFQVNDFISVTPGVYMIMNPEHNNKNDDIWVGVLRTTFSF